MKPAFGIPNLRFKVESSIKTTAYSNKLTYRMLQWRPADAIM